MNINILTKLFDAAVAGRDDISFAPLFSFLYRDGHQMLTMGGMLVGSREQALLNAPFLRQKSYMRFSWEEDPFTIVVPNLTRKERIFLEGSMPAIENWTPKTFELSQEEVQAYQKIYRFYPVYAELFL